MGRTPLILTLIAAAAAAALWPRAALAPPRPPETTTAPASMHAQPTAQPHSNLLVRLNLVSRAQLATVLNRGIDLWGEAPGLGARLCVLDSTSLAALRAAGITAEVIHDDVQSLIDAQKRPAPRQRSAPVGPEARGEPPSFFDAFPDLDASNSFLDALAAQRPDLVQTFSVGLSRESREIRGVRIRGLNTPAHTRPALLITACQHAREWITVTSALYVAEALVQGYDADPSIHDLLDEVEIIIVPIVNPDGYVFSWTTDRMWRKNRRQNTGGSWGVDLNRNWGHQWGGPGSGNQPGLEDYRGPSAFSEPETANLRNFVQTNAHIRAHVDLHSFAQLVLGVWGYTGLQAPDGEALIPLGRDIAAAISNVDGAPHTFGYGGHVLGLASGIMPDWMYAVRGVLAWTIEMRDTGELGYLLPPDHIIPAGEEALAAMRTVAERLRAPLALAFPDDHPLALAPDTATPLRVKITDISGEFAAGSLRRHARIGGAGPFVESTPSSLGAGVFQATLPAAMCGLDVQHYYTAMTTDGRTVSFPPDAQQGAFTVRARASTTSFHDNFDTDLGWTVGAPEDTATTGVWVRVDPIGTDAQPGDDNPAGTGIRCFVTGAGTVQGEENPGLADVDGGRTTLTSPRLDALALPGDPHISYYRWLSNNLGEGATSEPFTALVSNDDGATWTILEEINDENWHAWKRKEFRVADLVAPTDMLRLRFIARDEEANGGALVEAAIDDVRLTFLDCAEGPPGDVNGDGVVNSSDLGQILGAWGPCEPGQPCPADLTGDTVVNSSDLGIVLGAWGG